LLVWLDNLENIGHFKTRKTERNESEKNLSDTHVIYQKKSPEARKHIFIYTIERTK
jgi:hypothetical protein